MPTRHGLFFERFRDPNARWAPPFIILIDKAKKDRFVELAKSRYPGLVASGALSFLRMWSSDVIPWLAADLVRRKGNPEFDLGQIPLDDQVTFELLRSPNPKIPWIGSFHFQVGREGLLRLEPASIAELAALSALLRMNVDYGHLFQQRVGTTKCWEPVHPVLAEATADSKGLILFQEQVMMVLNRLGGIPVEDGYDFITAAAKKKSGIVAQYQTRFLMSARENGIAPKAAEAIFDHLRVAASFVFCKAHCIGEAMVVYHAAYLKAHYPAEFNQAVRLAMA